MSLKAGTAVRDVSPRKPMFLYGYPHVPRTSEGVHDPLYASALCLRNGADGVLLVATDILDIPTEDARGLRAALARSAGLPEAHVFISASHTHSGPVTGKYAGMVDDPVVPDPDPEYLAFFRDQVLAAGTEAAAAGRDAELAWTSAQVDGVGCNRLSPDAPRDPEAGILAVREPGSRRMTGVALVYSMHPTVIHEDTRLVSSDFPGYTRLALKEAFGGECAVLYHNGPSGNQSPRYHVRGQTFAEAERLGRRLAGFVAASVRGLRDEDYRPEAALGGRLASVTLRGRRMPSVTEAEANLRACRETYERLKREGAGHGPVRTAECTVFGAEETVTLARLQQDGRLQAAIAAHARPDVQAVRIGDACLAGLPGELFVEYGLEIKRRAARRSFPVCLVNGGLQGYIVTPEAAAQGGYEATNAIFEPESGSLLVEAAVDLIARM